MGVQISVHWNGRVRNESCLKAYARFVCDDDCARLPEVAYTWAHPLAYLFTEAVVKDKAPIPASFLRKRLPRALCLIDTEASRFRGGREEWLENDKRNFRDFVALCECIEAETGSPLVFTAHES
jgi:hypothetical protein